MTHALLAEEPGESKDSCPVLEGGASKQLLLPSGELAQRQVAPLTGD